MTEAILTVLVPALLTGVLVFAREQINGVREDTKETIKYYRDQVLPILERQQDILEMQQDQIKRLIDEWNGPDA